jgi:60kDa lysophospholipase
VFVFVLRTRKQIFKNDITLKKLNYPLKSVFSYFINLRFFISILIEQPNYITCLVFSSFSHIVLAPIPNQLVKRIRRYPHMHDEDYAQARYGNTSNMAPLVLPYVEGEHRRIIYTISEYEPLLDSSNMSISDWVRIAEDIKHSYEFFDGFVILHGTDTLSYTASALSFMLENLGKTVIITGAQIPIFEIRTDGKDNLLSALIIAGNYVIPGRCKALDLKNYR